MTNHWIDLQNCKTILVEGSNVAENHPMSNGSELTALLAERHPPWPS